MWFQCIANFQQKWTRITCCCFKLTLKLKKRDTWMLVHGLTSPLTLINLLGCFHGVIQSNFLHFQKTEGFSFELLFTVFWVEILLLSYFPAIWCDVVPCGGAGVKGHLLSHMRKEESERERERERKKKSVKLLLEWEASDCNSQPCTQVI